MAEKDVKVPQSPERAPAKDQETKAEAGKRVADAPVVPGQSEEARRADTANAAPDVPRRGGPPETDAEAAKREQSRIPDAPATDPTSVTGYSSDNPGARTQEQAEQDMRERAEGQRDQGIRPSGAEPKDRERSAARHEKDVNPA